MRRVCDLCKRPLTGRRGHGFVSSDGRVLQCGGCATRGRVTIHAPARFGDAEDHLALAAARSTRRRPTRKGG